MRFLHFTLGELVKLRFVIMLAFAFVLQPHLAHAEDMTLSDLKDICSAHIQGPTPACKFFIYGVYEGLQMASEAAKDKTHFCLPDDVSSAFMVEMVKERMREDLAKYPEDAKMPAVSFVGAAFAHEFPCKNQSPTF
jgi:hypothetical protein